jgi:intracellular sulfur oxidation DsrE/DsrF family protein
MSDHYTSNGRRQFLGQIAAAGAGTIALSGLGFPQPATAETMNDPDPDKWFNQLKGKHRVVFDCTRPHETMPFAWPRVFMMTNAATGSPEADCGVVVVLRHAAIPYAFDHGVWEKYKFGEVFKADDPKTGKPSTRNPFWKPAAGDFKVPGVGPVNIGINELQQSGVMFCVCNMAMTVYTNVVAGQTNAKVEDVQKEWMSALLPGVQVVPSGVWALGRAQEHGCAYIFAG